MSVLENFKNIPRSPSHRATRSKCNFFLQICNEVSEEKKRGNGRQGGPVAPPSGNQWARPTSAAGGPVAPPASDRGA